MTCAADERGSGLSAFTNQSLTLNESSDTTGKFTYNGADAWTLTLPAGVIGPVKSVVTADCTGTNKVIGLKLISGELGVDCGADLSGGTSSLTTKKTESSSGFDSLECDKGDVVKGLKFDGSELRFLCDSVGSSYGNDKDSSYNSSGNLSSNSVSSATCSGTTGFAYGLTYTNSKLTIACTGTIPTFSDNAIFTSGSSGTFGYDGRDFRVTLPSGVMGLTLGSSVRCTDSGDRVYALTTDSDGKLKVLCSSGATGSAGAAATISVGTVTTGLAGSSASITNVGTTSAAVFNFTIPRGATGIQGPPGSKGDDGKDGKDGVTPTISVDPSIKSGNAGVSVSKSGDDYKFTFTLPTVPVGYDEKYACFKSNGEVTISNTKYGSKECSGTQYKILLDSSP